MYALNDGGTTNDVAEHYLTELHKRVANRFRRAEPRRRIYSYVRGLLSETARKNSWTIAEQAGEPSPDGMQRLLRQAAWDADGVRDDVRDFVVERLGVGTSPAYPMLIVGETEFVKRGNDSCAVERQFARGLQRLENCQVGLFCAYLTDRGCGLIDRELHLPRSWSADTGRRRAARVPDDVTWVPRSELARQIIERNIEAGVPARTVMSPDLYGRDAGLRGWLEDRDQPYTLGIDGPDVVALVDPRPGEPSQSAPEVAWRRVPLTTKRPSSLEHWLLLASGEHDARFLCGSPASTTMESLVQTAVTGAASFRRCIASARTTVGLDRYQLRSWPGWYRHMTLALMANACVGPTAA